MGFTLITITGRFSDATDKPANGRLSATLSETMNSLEKGGLNTASTQPIVTSIENGKLATLKLCANDDSDTLPQRTYYTFELFLFGVQEVFTFKAQVPHEATEGEIDYTELLENSGKVGTKKIKPKLNAEQTTINEVASALVALELAEWAQTPSPDANEFTK